MKLKNTLKILKILNIFYRQRKILLLATVVAGDNCSQIIVSRSEELFQNPREFCQD